MLGEKEMTKKKVEGKKLSEKDWKVSQKMFNMKKPGYKKVEHEGSEESLEKRSHLIKSGNTKRKKGFFILSKENKKKNERERERESERDYGQMMNS